MEVYFGWVGEGRHFFGRVEVSGGIFWIDGGGRE